MKDANGIDEILKESEDSEVDEYIERHKRMEKQKKLNLKIQKMQ